LLAAAFLLPHGDVSALESAATATLRLHSFRTTITGDSPPGTNVEDRIAPDRLRLVFDVDSEPLTFVVIGSTAYTPYQCDGDGVVGERYTVRAIHHRAHGSGEGLLRFLQRGGAVVAVGSSRSGDRYSFMVLPGPNPQGSRSLGQLSVTAIVRKGMVRSATITSLGRRKHAVTRRIRYSFSAFDAVAPIDPPPADKITSGSMIACSFTEAGQGLG
jgi:hypothetical protein